MRKVPNKTFMNIPPIERWSDNRFENGVDVYLDFADSNPYASESGLIYCPCKRCKNAGMLSRYEIQSHLITWGFVKDLISGLFMVKFLVA